jgi:hypothetical protein
MMQLSIGLAFAATIAVIAASIPQTANSAERTCRQECVGPVCQERCVETDGRAEPRIQERREDRFEERREERREDRGERRPGIELRVPGVGVEIERR